MNSNSSKDLQNFPRSEVRTSEPVRKLDATDIGFDSTSGVETFYVPPETRDIEEDDPILASVRQLLVDGYAGVILVGPPGTGKTWYADRISRKLVDFENHPERRRLVQFHHSYQYEDFVESFVPQEQGGFTLEPRHLLKMCEIARDAAPDLCVLVLDELSRSDPSRVFGEALTYIEMDKRERKFHLASGSEVSIPRSLVMLATMNPFDSGADQVDAAFERRFAKIAMEPSVEALKDILDRNGMGEDLKQRVVEFFHFLQNQPNQQARVGHAYFIHARDEKSLKRLWDHQLRFHLQRAFQLSPESYNRAEKMWKQVLPPSDNENATGNVITETQVGEDGEN